jgi:hypothetical protein
MLIHRSSNNAGKYERQTGRGDSFYFGANGYPIFNNKSKKVNLLNIVAYTLGIPLTAWAAWLYVGGWKGNLIVGLASAFWLIKLITAVIRLYYEMKEKEIELEEKRARYKKD